MAASRSAAVRERLDHPVIDADGHTIEFGPGVAEKLRELAGDDAARRFQGAGEFGWYRMPEQRRDTRLVRPPWWALPAENTRPSDGEHRCGYLKVLQHEGEATRVEGDGHSVDEIRPSAQGRVDVPDAQRSSNQIVLPSGRDVVAHWSATSRTRCRPRPVSSVAVSGRSEGGSGRVSWTSTRSVASR
jgi:hypothetical protein